MVISQSGDFWELVPFALDILDMLKIHWPAAASYPVLLVLIYQGRAVEQYVWYSAATPWSALLYSYLVRCYEAGMLLQCLIFLLGMANTSHWICMMSDGRYLQYTTLAVKEDSSTCCSNRLFFRSRKSEEGLGKIKGNVGTLLRYTKA